MARRNSKRVTKSNPTRNRTESKQEDYKKEAPSSKSKVPNSDSESDGKALTREEQEKAYQEAFKNSYARSANDPEWYNADPQLLMDSASFPYAYPFGDVLRFLDGTVSIGNKTINEGPYRKFAIPGICSLSIKPSLGYSFNKNDAPNVCANAFFTHVRVANSGRKNYEAVDLMMYALSIAEIYSFVFWCERLYGYMFTYSQRNKYIARALLEANGVKYTSMLNNLANFRYWLNAFINKICAWVVPADINIFKRRAFMYSSVYLENPDGNIKDQLYQFIPDGFYRFQLDETSRGKLQYKRFDEWSSGELIDVEEIFNIGNWMIENINGDEDFAIMSGDILKAYGTERIIGMSAMPEEVYITPTHDALVLSQFRNATVLNTYRGGDAPYIYETADNTFEFPSGDIAQDNNGNIICYELISTDGPNHVCTAVMNKILNVENPLPGPADSIEASRLLFSVKDNLSPFKIKVAKDSWTKDKTLPTFTCGCDYVTNVRITVYGQDANLNPTMQQYNYNCNVFNEPQSDPIHQYMDYMWSMFKYTPNRFMPISSPAATGVDAPRLISNVDNYTIISYNEVQKMHECALLSLFFVPGVAKMVNYL